MAQPVAMVKCSALPGCLVSLGAVTACVLSHALVAGESSLSLFREALFFKSSRKSVLFMLWSASASAPALYIRCLSSMVYRCATSLPADLPSLIIIICPAVSRGCDRNHIHDHRYPLEAVSPSSVYADIFREA